MRLEPDCIPCAVRSALREAKIFTNNRELHKKVLRETLKIIMNSDWNETSLNLGFKIHTKVRKILGSKDPYSRIKKEVNNLALNMYPELKKIVERSDDKVETALKLAIAGNILDFAPYEFPNLRKAVEKVLNEEFAVNDYLIFKSKVLKSNTILYFLDNAGEIVLDKLFLETLIRERGEPYRRITWVVKGGPFINDATIEDAVYVGLDKLPNSIIKTISNGEEGTGPKPNSLEVREWIRNHDITISKGQGNFEALEEEKNIFFLLMAKCYPIANVFRVKPGEMIIKYST